jgi:hypothetical protein
MKYVRVLAAAVGVQLVLVCAPKVLAQQPAPAAQAPSAQTPTPGRGRGPIPIDPRVQIRMHHFADTNEDIPYALFVSSKVIRGRKAPMIVSLHGLGGTHTTMMRPNAIDLAESGGYILLAPMGYNPRGWYGIPAGPRRGGAPPNAAPNPTGAAAPANTAPANAATANAGRQGRGRGGGGGGPQPTTARRRAGLG